MSDYSKLTVTELLDAFASNQPVPGGGSAAALAGAVGASLFMMVASLPRTRQGTSDERERLDAAAARLRPIRDELVWLVDRDSDAYASVMEALRLPKSTGAEQDVRRRAIDAAMRAATEAPLATLRACHDALRELAVIGPLGARSAMSDLDVAVGLLTAAVRGAAANVDTNLAAMKDAEYAGRAGRERQDLERAINALLP